MVKNAKHPIDWGLITIKEICKSLNYGTSKKSTFSGKCAVLRMGNLQNGYIDWTDLVYTNDEKDIQKYSLVKGDVLFNRTNSADLVGKTSLYRGEYPAIYAGYLIRLNYDRKKVVGEYLNYILNTQEAKEYCLAVKTDGVSQSNINAQKIGAFLFHLPPFEEQEKISEALSDVDNLIFSLQKLIEKKKAIKQGTMQELLTGKKRLPGFSEEWAYRRVGEICSITKGQIITEKTAIHGNVPVIAGGKTPAFYHNVANRESDVITISASGANAGYIAYHDYPIFASDCSTIESSDQYDVKFIYYALLYHQQELIGMQTGGAQPHIHPKEIGVLLVPRINQEEQRAIANVLSDMDSEIEQLEKKLAKYQQIKQGMMQELLTGRIRLV